MYILAHSPQHSMNRRLVGPQNWSGNRDEERERQRERDTETDIYRQRKKSLEK